jgi:sphinganine-1-phosphate aldolase
LFAYVYTTEGDEHWSLVRKAFESTSNTESGAPDVKALVNEAYNMFSHENGLNPFAFPSLRRFETEVISMSASMLNGDANVTGALTSGGT